MPPRTTKACARLSCVLLALVACGPLAAPGARSTSHPAAPAAPAISTESLPALLQRGAGAFAAGDFASAASAFRAVEQQFRAEAEWTSGALPRSLLPLRGFAELRTGQPNDAIETLGAFLERFPEEANQRSFVLYSLALALEESGRAEEALARFAEFEAEVAGSAQAALARMRRAEILFELDRAQEAFPILTDLANDEYAAESLRTQARLRALQQAVDLKQDDLAAHLLFDRPWEIATMPEIAVLGFAAMETGDRLMAAGKPGDAVRAFRLVLPKDRLVAAQRARLADLQTLFEERSAAAAAGTGAFWVDFYRERMARIEAQLHGLEASEDYTAPLALRQGQAFLLANRNHEAWLCFEKIATDPAVGESLRSEAHYRWILAAAALERWPEALTIAREFVTRFPASDQAPDAFQLIARAHLEQRRYAEAGEVLTDILSRFPEHSGAARARFTRGWVRAMREDNVAAREDFAQCVRDQPGGPFAVQAELWRGLTFFFERDHASALKVFDALAESTSGHPLHPEVLYRRATTLYAMRDFPRARMELENFVTTFSMHPRHAEALVLLGDVLMGQGELKLARQRFAEVAPEAADSFVYAAFQTGKILKATKDHDGMIAHFSHYAQREDRPPLPRVSEALYWIGWAEEQRGHPEAALPVYAEALQRFGNDPSAAEVGATLSALAKLARRIGRTESEANRSDSTEALRSGDFHAWLLEEIERAAILGLTTYRARLRLALADWHAAHKEPAQEELALLEIAGDTPVEALDAPCLARVGTALQGIGSDDASGYFRHLLASLPRSPERGVAYHGLAVESERARRFDDALAWIGRFESETPIHPLGPQVALLAASVFEQTGRIDDAATRYQSLLALKTARGRPHAAALAGLARCAIARGEEAKAIAYYQRIYTLYRAQHDIAAEAYLGSAPLFASLGDLGAAASTYREMLRLPDIGDSTQRETARAALAAIESNLAPAESAP